MTLGRRSGAVETRRPSVGVPAGVPRRGRLGGAGHGHRSTAGRDANDRRWGGRRLVVHGDERRSVEHVDAVVSLRRTANIHERDHRASTTTTTRPAITTYQSNALNLAVSKHADTHTDTHSCHY